MTNAWKTLAGHAMRNTCAFGLPLNLAEDLAKMYRWQGNA